MKDEFPDIQARFRKCRGNRNQIEKHLLDHRKSRKYQKISTPAFVDCFEAFDCGLNKPWEVL